MGESLVVAGTGDLLPKEVPKMVEGLLCPDGTSRRYLLDNVVVPIGDADVLGDVNCVEDVRPVPRIPTSSEKKKDG